MLSARDQLAAALTEALGLVELDELVVSSDAWESAVQPRPPFLRFLEARGTLSPAQVKLVDALTREALGRTGGDAPKALGTLPASLRARLARVSVTVRSDPGRRLDDVEAAAAADGAAEVSTSGPRGWDVPFDAPGRYEDELGRDGEVTELGRGGVGRVVLSRDRYLGRELAMKELLPKLVTAARDTMERSIGLEQAFLREARITAQLEHPGVVPVYDLGRKADGTLRYSMQRVRGRSLSEALSDAGSLPARLAFVPDVLIVCRAVSAAHHRGYLHRDLKPQNVMLGAFGATFLMDWGLATRSPNAAAPGAPAKPRRTRSVEIAVGTPAYMSPEQAKGDARHIDEQTDVFGLGAILFELLTGRAVYVGGSVLEVLGRAREGQIPNVARYAPEAPPELLAICGTALAADKAGRYASARAMADDLAAWLDDGMVSVYRYSFRELAGRFARRNRAAAAVVTAALVGLTVTLAAGTWQARAERDEAVAFSRFALDELGESLQDAPGAAPLLDRLIDSSLSLYASTIDPRASAREDVLRLGQARWQVGFVQWQAGRWAQARAAYDLAEAAAAGVLSRSPTDPEALALWVRARSGKGQVTVDEGHAAEGLAEFRALAPTIVRALADAPSSLKVIDAAAFLHSRTSAVLQNSNRFAEAMPDLDRAIELRRRRQALLPSDGLGFSKLAYDLGSRGLGKLSLDQLDDARRDLVDAVAAADQAVALQPTPRVRGIRATVRHNLARLELQARRMDACAAAARLVVEDFEAALAADPDHVANRWLEGEALLFLGKPAEAWARTRQLGALPDYDGFLAAVAFAAGEDAAAESFARGSTWFEAESFFLRAVLAERAGRHGEAAEALEHLGTQELDLSPLAPHAVSLRAPSLPGPSGARIARWTAVLLERPRPAVEMRAVFRALASEVRQVEKESPR